jgi:hypothetical protein
MDVSHLHMSSYGEKAMPKEKLLAGLSFRCREKSWVTNKLMIGWIKAFLKQRPGFLLLKRGMFVGDAFKRQFTLQAEGGVIML